MKFMSTQGQGHSLTFVQDHSDFINFKLFLSNPTGPIEAKFHVEPPWEREAKICSNGPGFMTKMAAMPIYGKNLQKSTSLEPFGRCP